MGPDELHDPYCRACEIAQADYIELEKVVDDLALLVRRLSHKIKRIDPDNDLSSKAMDYLSRNNLAGSHIREEELLDLQTLRGGEKMSEEYPSCFNETYRKARKLHICCECRQEIKPGDRYRYTSGIWRDKPEAFKQCGICAAIFDACADLAKEHDYFPDEYPSYGDLSEFVLEEINGYPESIKRFDFCNSTYWAQRIDEYTKE